MAQLHRVVIRRGAGDGEDFAGDVKARGCGERSGAVKLSENCFVNVMLLEMQGLLANVPLSANVH